MVRDKCRKTGPSVRGTPSLSHCDWRPQAQSDKIPMAASSLSNSRPSTHNHRRPPHPPHSSTRRCFMATAVAPNTIKQPQVRHTECFIGGKWVPAASGKTFETFNPATEQVIAQVAEGDEEDINAAVAAAHDQFEGGEWRKM